MTTEREELLGTLSNTICNASLYPRRATAHLLGSDMSEVLNRTADAILAAGWSRLVLDDAAVERAARALAGTLSVFKWEHIGPLTQEMYRDKARAVLAAAVEPPDA